MLLYVLCQAHALANRFSESFKTIKNLSVSLGEKNLALRREMEERNKLKCKLINISEEERRRISSQLHDGLCQHLTGARRHCTLLEDAVVDNAPAAEEPEQVNTPLDASVNEAYDMSRGLWPVDNLESPQGRP